MGLLHRILGILGVLQIKLGLRLQFVGQGTSLPRDVRDLFRLLSKFHRLLLGPGQSLSTFVIQEVEGLLQFLLGVLGDLVQNGIVLARPVYLPIGICLELIRAH